MVKIVTERLTLREIKSKDIFGYSELYSDEDTMRQFGGPPITDDLRIANLIEQKRKEEAAGISLFWTITISDEKEFIGFIRLMSYNSVYFDLSFEAMGDLRNDREFLSQIDKNGWEVDYALMKDYRNQGIMTEALEGVLEYCLAENFKPIYAKVNSLENKATIAVLEKLAFSELLPQISNEGQMGMIYVWDNQ